MRLLLALLLLPVFTVSAASSTTFTILMQKSGRDFPDPVALNIHCYGNGDDKALQDFFNWSGRCTGSCTIGPVDLLPGEPERIGFCNVEALAQDIRYTSGSYPINGMTCAQSGGGKACRFPIDVGLMRDMLVLPSQQTAVWTPLAVYWNRTRRLASDTVVWASGLWCQVLHLLKKSC